MKLAHQTDAFRHADWRKSTRSASNYQCVEVAVTSWGVGVRDSKAPDGGTLAFEPHQWAVFLNSLHRP